MTKLSTSSVWTIAVTNFAWRPRVSGQQRSPHVQTPTVWTIPKARLGVDQDMKGWVTGTELACPGDSVCLNIRDPERGAWTR